MPRLFRHVHDECLRLMTSKPDRDDVSGCRLLEFNYAAEMSSNRHLNAWLGGVEGIGIRHGLTGARGDCRGTVVPHLIMSRYV